MSGRNGYRGLALALLLCCALLLPGAAMGAPRAGGGGTTSGYSISGVLKGAVSQVPAAGVTVRLYVLSKGVWRVSSQVVSAADGRYGFTGLSSGSYRVQFEKADWFASMYWPAQSALESQTLIVLDSKNPAKVCDASLWGLGRICGFIESEMGRDMPPGTVSGTLYSGAAVVPFTPAPVEYWDYAVDGVEPGTYRIRFSAPGYQDEYYTDKHTLAEAAPVVLAPAPYPFAALGISFLDLAPGTASVSGRVFGPEGQPLAGETVIVYHAGSASSAGQHTVTSDASGGYLVKDLPAGSYSVSVLGYIGNASVTLAEGQSVVMPDQHVLYAGRIKVFAAEEGGSRLTALGQYAEAYRWDGSAWTLVSSAPLFTGGITMVENLPVGTYRLRVWEQDWLTGAIREAWWDDTVSPSAPNVESATDIIITKTETLRNVTVYLPVWQ